jgi:hypothetical protein
VTSPDQSAGDRDRSAAIKLVDEALRSGRIVQADRDMRVDQLEHAQTMQDIDLQVRDLRPPSATPPATAPQAPPTPGQPGVPVGGQPWPLVNYGPGSSETAGIATSVGKTGGKAIGGIIALIVVISVIVPIAGAVIAFVSARDSFPDLDGLGPTDDTTFLPGQAPSENGVNVHTVEGYHDLVDALREEKGDTFTYTTVIYPRYAVLDVPTGTNNRYQSFYWDGEDLELQDIKGLSSGEQLDLSLVDPGQMIAMLETVRGRIENPESWYVVISDQPELETQIAAYASNDFGENTYQVQTLDGTVVYDSPVAE